VSTNDIVVSRRNLMWATQDYDFRISVKNTRPSETVGVNIPLSKRILCDPWFNVCIVIPCISGQINGYPDPAALTIMTYILLDGFQIRPCNDTEFYTRITAKDECIEASYAIVRWKQHQSAILSPRNPRDRGERKTTHAPRP
jgi:hypothetical protein